jgi:serine/threonine protein kinase
MTSKIKISDKYEMFTDIFLGKGSFSIVYKGGHITSGTQVAIKVINVKNLTASSKKIIEDEIKIMEIIEENPHPNIVECFDVVRTDEKIYLIMEYCDSGDLRSILKNPIKEKYTQFYFSQLANGLKYLDMHNIIHRDIKPRNILLTNKRKVLKIADFGFAKQSHKSINMYDTMCGSPLYMAPEIMERVSYNKQTDLWSIGIILYEMLYGIHPLEQCKNISSLKNTISTQQIPIPPKNNTNKSVSRECLSLLEMLIQKDVNNRITWEDFFDHSWFKKYQYNNTTGHSPTKSIVILNKNNKTYKEQICALSIGSLEASSYKKNTNFNSNKKNVFGINSPNLSSNSVIIPDYYDSIFDTQLERESVEDFIFKMDSITDANTDIKIIGKSITDESTVLDNKVDKSYNKYKVIDEF